MTLDELGGWPAVLRRLVAGEDLTAPEAGAALTDILSGDASPAHVAAFLVAIGMKGATVDELAGMVAAAMAAAEPIPVPPGLDPVDTCGSGGSPHRRVACFNVSTIASLVAAGAGAVVCKHGGRAATATSSSGDAFAALGVAAELGPAGVARCLDEAGIAFCFAPRFHPGWRHPAPVRRELGIPTVFNFLGPLANPARVRHQVLGVSNPAMAERLMGVLQARGAERAMVVYGHDGLDELTTTTLSTVLELRDGSVRTSTVDPASLGLAYATEDDLRGGDAATNADLARRVLAGEQGPHRDIVLLNAAAALVVAGVADDLEAGLAAATASVDDGAAAAALERLVAVSTAAQAAEI